MKASVAALLGTLLEGVFHDLLTGLQGLMAQGHGLWIWLQESSCRHVHAPMEEGHCICPTCGEGITRAWVELRCEQCGCRRNPRYGRWGQVEPVTPCCVQCGTRAVRQRQLERPEYFQVRQALLMTVRSPVDLPYQVVSVDEVPDSPEDCLGPWGGLPCFVPRVQGPGATQAA